MSETIVAVDAMGGDNAPGEIVKGAVDAINKTKDLRIVLVGDEQAIHSELKKYQFDYPRITIKATTEVIETAEPPVNAIKKKKDSSLVVAMQMIKSNEADAMVSAGNSGAILVGGQLYAGRIKGIKRAPLAPLIARPEHLLQFARMGSIYMEHVMGKKNPRVAIVNIGAEEEKGNALVKETFPLLKEASDINFIGSIEAREIPSGYADVIVCEAFVGNVILKMYEGVSKTFLKVMKEAFMSSLKSKIGAALAVPALKKKLVAFDATQYGGAPLLGLNGLIVKTHGSAKAKEVTNSIIQCISFKEQNINKKIRESFSQEDK